MSHRIPPMTTPITPAQLAACLEQEWAGVLFPGECLDPLGGLSRWEAGMPPFLPSDYHGRVAERIGEALGGRIREVRHVREVGGGTGGFAREFLARRAVETFELVELSAEKARHADYLLNGAGSIRGIPLIGEDSSITWRAVESPAPARGRVRVRVGKGEEGGGGKVDLLVSLNVADRVERPGEFAAAMGNQVRPGGWLALASPLDWLQGVTPPAGRVDDLEELIPAGFRIIGEGEDFFPFRSHPRRVVVFLSRLLILEKRRKTS